MRNISFFLTQKQIKNRTKRVTRRNGWRFLKAGDLLHGCVKCQGLKKGERIKGLCFIKVVSVMRVRLKNITKSDVKLEGFPEMTPAEFVAMYCKHMGGTPGQWVTRIEFNYV